MKASLFISLALIGLTLGCGVSSEQYDALVSELRTTREITNNLQLRLDNADEEIRTTQDQLNIALAQFRNLRELSTELESDLADTNETLDAHKIELAKLRPELEQTKALLETQNTEIANLSDDLSLKDEAISSLEAENADLEEQHSALQSSFDEIGTENDGLAEKVASLEKANTENEGIIQTREEHIVTLDRLVRSLTDDNALLQKELEANSVEHIQAEIADLKIQRDDWIKKLNELQESATPLLENENIELKAAPLHCTGSMLPLLHCGDLVVVKTNISYFDVEVGDIISFRYRDCFGGQIESSSLVLHRVVEIDAGWFVTKGDNNFRNDSCRLPIRNVEGEVLTWFDDLYPEHYFETDNFEQEKLELNSLLETYDSKLARYNKQLEKLEEAEDDYNDGRISYGKYTDVWQDTENDRLELLELKNDANSQYAKIQVMQDLIIARVYKDNEWAD